MCTTGNDTAGTRKNWTETTTMAKSRNPKTANAAAELAAATREYRELASRIGGLGLIHHGSVIHRYAAPDTGGPGTQPAKRGRSPYYQWSSKAGGKTITRTLTEDEAELYQEWIENDRKLRVILKEMRRASEHATQLILKQKVK